MRKPCFIGEARLTLRQLTRLNPLTLHSQNSRIAVPVRHAEPVALFHSSVQIALIATCAKTIMLPGLKTVRLARNV